MIRLVRDCAVAVIAYVNVGIELFCPTIGEALRGKGFDRNDDE